jgi:hypothetical protein
MPSRATMQKVIDLGKLQLASGGHSSPEAGMCVMEATAYIAGEKFSDSPECVSPVIAAFCRSWNDGLGDEARNRLLKPYITKIIGTNTGAADDEVRAWMATDWLVRVQTPAWLDLAGLKDDAERLRNLPALTSSEIALAVQDTLDQVRASASSRAAAAWAAAWAAARDAARDAAWAAARDAAWDAAWAAARDAARDAAWAAARAAARDAAWAAARDAAWAAAWAAARDAAWDALQPTVDSLQGSALELLDRMIAVGRTVDSTLATAPADAEPNTAELR